MAGNISGGHISLLPGMSIELKVSGYFARTDVYKVYNEETGETEQKTLTNGFYVEDEEVGSITAIEGRTAVRYFHKKAQENNIWFIARTYAGGAPEQGLFRIIYVPVHDHATLVTGGPAHATYHSEGYREEET